MSKAGVGRETVGGVLLDGLLLWGRMTLRAVSPAGTVPKSLYLRLLWPQDWDWPASFPGADSPKDSVGSCRPLTTPGPGPGTCPAGV